MGNLENILAQKTLESDAKKMIMRTASFSDDEKDYWRRFIAENTESGKCIIEDDIYSDVVLYSGRKINKYRLDALEKFVGDMGLYLHYTFSSFVEVLDINAVRNMVRC